MNMKYLRCFLLAWLIFFGVRGAGAAVAPGLCGLRALPQTVSVLPNMESHLWTLDALFERNDMMVATSGFATQSASQDDHS